MNQQLYGVMSGLAAFTAWGFLPAYRKQMQEVSAFEILIYLPSEFYNESPRRNLLIDIRKSMS